MVDYAEAARRGQPARKCSQKHPYAAIEHRIIDSPAYADLTFSAQALIVLFARQITAAGNNGHLHASFQWCHPRGFGSEHTLRNAIAELIAHGLIYRTRSHGANKAWARYALTWIPIKNRDGLFLDNFRPNAWRDWKTAEKKTTRQKVLDQSGRKCSFTTEHPAESAGSRGAKTADYELVASISTTATHQSSLDYAHRHAGNSLPFAWAIPFTHRMAARGQAPAYPAAIFH